MGFDGQVVLELPTANAQQSYCNSINVVAIAPSLPKVCTIIIGGKKIFLTVLLHFSLFPLPYFLLVFYFFLSSFFSFSSPFLHSFFSVLFFLELSRFTNRPNLTTISVVSQSTYIASSKPTKTAETRHVSGQHQFDPKLMLTNRSPMAIGHVFFHFLTMKVCLFIKINEYIDRMREGQIWKL